MLNVKISLVSASYSEESATLSRTLLPFINKVTDYRFLGVDTHFIMGRFLSSLIMHVKDVQEQVSQGFVSLALHLNPSTLKEVIRIGNGILSLREALLVRGFQASAVNAMCLYP